MATERWDYHAVRRNLELMVEEVEWMSRVDQSILEFMIRCDEGRALLTPKVIAENIHYTRSYVGNRLRDPLMKYGLVNAQGSGFYRLTDDGRAYLAGDLDASQLEPRQ